MATKKTPAPSGEKRCVLTFHWDEDERPLGVALDILVDEKVVSSDFVPNEYHPLFGGKAHE